MATSTPNPNKESAVQFEAQIQRLNRALRSVAPALRRRGVWLVFGALGGLMGGFFVAATATTPVTAQRYYKATAVMRLAEPGSVPSGADPAQWSLQQAQTAIVSDAYRLAVATQSGKSTRDVRNHVLSVAYQGTATVELTAVTKDRYDAVLIAYHAAQELNDAIAEKINGGTSSADRADQLLLVDAITEGLQAKLADAQGADRAQIIEKLEDLERHRTRISAPAESRTTGLPEFELVSSPEAIQINQRAYFTRWWVARHNVSVPRIGVSASLADVGSGTGNEGDAVKRLLSETKIPMATNPHPIQPISLGLLAGLVMGLSGVVLGEAWDDRIHDTAHAIQSTGLQPIAGIPHLTQRSIRALATASTDSARTRPRLTQALVRYREAASILATQVGLAPGHVPAPDTPRREAPILVITSSSPSEGKTTTTAALARALADLSLDVLVVDGDYHKRSLRKAVRPIPSFVDPEAPAVTRHPKVWYLDDPASAVRRSTSSAIVGRLIRRARNVSGDYDIVVFDAPPILSTTDAIEYLQYADAAVLVVRVDQTVVPSAQQAANTILRHSQTRPELIVTDVPMTPLDRHSNDGG